MVVRVRRRQGGSGRADRAVRIVDSLAAVAEFAGVSVPSASAWFDRGAPVLPDGRYDLWDIARWHGENRGRRPDAAAAGAAVAPVTDASDSLDAADGTRSNWDVRRVRAAALTAELKLQEAQGKVVTRTDYDAALFALIDSFVRALEAMPLRVTPLLLAARGYQEISDILCAHIRTMRIQLAAKHSPKGVDAESGDDADVASGGGVGGVSSE